MEERAVLLELDQSEENNGTPVKSSCCRSCPRKVCFLCHNVGFIGIVGMVGILLLGIMLLAVVKLQDVPEWVNQLSLYIISAGVFGLAGGGTNAIAVFMLVYKIPLLCGSG